jgi:DNA-directed RNA polymerase subunit H (RpoH/RPB5)
MRRDDPFAQTVVPCHRQIDRGTLRAILRQTGITAEELSNLLYFRLIPRSRTDPIQKCVA